VLEVAVPVVRVGVRVEGQRRQRRVGHQRHHAVDQAGDQLPAITGEYRKWLASEPRRPEPPLLLAKALLAANVDSPEPELLLRRSLQLDSKDWESHYELGLLLSKKHEYAQAAAELKRSIELDPKQAMPHYHLARVYNRLGQKEQAQTERETHQRLTAK